MNENIYINDPFGNPLYPNEDGYLYDENRTKKYWKDDQGRLYLMQMIFDGKVYRQNQQGYYTDGKSDDLFTLTANGALQKIQSQNVVQPVENKYETYLSQTIQELKKVKESDMVRITFNIDNGNPPKCKFRLDRVYPDGEQVISEVNFTYNDELKKNFIEPIMEEYAKSGNIQATNVYGNTAEAYRSDMHSYTENGNIVNVTGVDDYYATELSKTISNTSEFVKGQIPEDAVLEDDSAVVLDADEQQKKQETGKRIELVNKPKQDWKQAGYTSIFALSVITGIFGMLFLLLAFLVYK